MTMTEMVNKVANSFIETMVEEEFSTFKEMKDCYWWDTSDIKGEMRYVIEKECDGIMYDDGSVTNDWYEDSISYKEFKKMVMAIIKNYELSVKEN